MNVAAKIAMATGKHVILAIVSACLAGLFLGMLAVISFPRPDGYGSPQAEKFGVAASRLLSALTDPWSPAFSEAGALLTIGVPTYLVLLLAIRVFLSFTNRRRFFT